MKILLIILLCLTSCGIIVAQTGPESIDKIPLCPDFVEFESDLSYWDTAYREELGSSFSNPDNVGPFKNYALKSTVYRTFRPPEHLGNLEQKAYDFYMKQLNATSIAPSRQEQPVYEPDISRLKHGEGTTVSFYPSWFGGGIHKWYFNDGNIKELTVTIGSPLLFVERTFVKELPVIVPSEEELGFPLYPGAEFCPLRSAWRKAPADLAEKNMVFQTTDDAQKVKAYFENKLSIKAKASEAGTSFSFVKQPPVPGTYQFSSLTIRKEREMESNIWNTFIEYHYPSP